MSMSHQTARSSTSATAARPRSQSFQTAINILTFLLKSPNSAFGIVVMALLILTAIFAPLIAGHDPYMQNLDNTLSPPSAAHFFGTDELGRDRFLPPSENSD